MHMYNAYVEIRVILDAFRVGPIVDDLVLCETYGR